MTEPAPSGVEAGRRARLGYALAALLGVFTYFYGLESDHIPKNGDEFVYENITRLTAQSGHWLPLQAGSVEMRNTKPPLLFWQGIASTDWGREWTLWRLRFPNAVYTLLTALLAFLLGSKLCGRREIGFAAALVFLAFFSTYRYGRPYLTDAPVVFWLFMPLFVILYWPGASESRVVAPLGLGLGIGVGLLYKSFALLVPVLATLSWWYFHRRGKRLRAFLGCDSLKLIIIGLVSLAVFGLWFVLDPDPRAIWRGFILGENLGKFDSAGRSYFRELLWGGSSIWRLVVSYPLNAGLLAFPVMLLFRVGFQRRHQMGDAERLLWVWTAALFLFFSLPSQRDERYLLPGMPALAVLCALNWERISRSAFVITLVIIGIGVAVVGYLSVRLQQGMADVRLYPASYWVLLAGLALLVALSLWRPGLTRPGAAVGTLLVSLVFAAFMRPLDGPVGNYDASARQYVVGKAVWVPINFRAKEEGYRFLLPGADVRGFPHDPTLSISALSARYPLFVVGLPLSEAPPAEATIIGQRLDVGSRHTPGQIKEMVRGHVFEHLFRKELLIEGAPQPTHRPAKGSPAALAP